jgi:hypothetical protein
MLLKGSCHCGKVTFSVESRTPYPYMHCYCSICRKTQGGGGFAINIMGESNSLKVLGKKYLSNYRARMREGRKVVRSPGRRYFCSRCGSCLWVHDPRWSQWVYPFASAIDTPLPRPREVQRILLNYAPAWVEVPKRKRDRHFREFPREAIIDWHKKRGLYQDEA